MQEKREKQMLNVKKNKKTDLFKCTVVVIFNYFILFFTFCSILRIVHVQGPLMDFGFRAKCNHAERENE